MTRDEQIRTVYNMGYSDREARFLVAVALHSGRFLMRQFDIRRGMAPDVLKMRVRHFGHAERYKWDARQFIYHLNARPFYAAIDQEDNRHRRYSEDQGYIRRKLMCLDYALEHSELHFLADEKEKADHFVSLGVAKDVLPTRVYKGLHDTETERYFVEKYPIYVTAEGRTGLCFLDDGLGGKGEFAGWIDRHRRLIQALSTRADVVYVATDAAAFEQARRTYEQMINRVSGEMARYLAMDRAAKEKGLPAFPKEWLDTYSELRKRLAGEAEMRVEPGQQALRCELLEHSYRSQPAYRDRAKQEESGVA